MTKSVEIIEVSPRDGIQNEKKLLSLDTKLALIDRAVKAGASRIEVTSFVNPKRVPQMAEADEICSALPRDTGCRYIGLALNRRGFERACNAALDEVNFVVVATNTFSEKNQGTDTDTGIKLFSDLADEAPATVGVGVTIAAAFGCPFEGEVSVEQFMHAVRGCMQANPFELARGRVYKQELLLWTQVLVVLVAVLLHLPLRVTYPLKILFTCWNVQV